MPPVISFLPSSSSPMLAARKPPTTNLLLHDERIRLMRSARKLGAVMGTTPLLLDPGSASELYILPRGGTSMEIILPVLKETRSETSHRSSKREGVVFTVSRSSTSSLESTEKRPAAPLPTVAKLSLSQESRNSLNAVTRLRLILALTQPSPSAGPCSSHHHSTDSLATLTSSLSILVSAPPPSTPDHAARRRKMVKLVHMLGGPVPPAMVFPPPPKPQPRTSRDERRRSRSVPPLSAPRKLVRAQPADDDHVLPALSIDRISRPRPLAAYPPSRGATASPTSMATASSAGSCRRARSVTPSYSLRRRVRDSKYASES
ncbi:hypothetical protein DFH09DRAFT_1186412 [Mycena vulgaris]|nr:hypothetical protein DFH09DRAFT_1186412 [Mycena vulgaris]